MMAAGERAPVAAQIRQGVRLGQPQNDMGVVWGRRQGSPCGRICPHSPSVLRRCFSRGALLAAAFFPAAFFPAAFFGVAFLAAAFFGAAFLDAAFLAAAFFAAAFLATAFLAGLFFAGVFFAAEDPDRRTMSLMLLQNAFQLLVISTTPMIKMTAPAARAGVIGCGATRSHPKWSMANDIRRFALTVSAA
jgi:hypothetical protein